MLEDSRAMILEAMVSIIIKMDCYGITLILSMIRKIEIFDIFGKICNRCLKY